VFKDAGQIAFQVTDEGNGFDHKQLPDPTVPENLLKLNGRGVFLMHQLCDEIDYLNNGRTVKMSFHICQQ
jgi:serine/threonine-protein kinase RsbW